MLPDTDGLLGGAAWVRPWRGLVFGRLGGERRGENEMSDTRFTVDHVRRTTDGPFQDVTTAFERRSGRSDPDVYLALAAGGDAERARARIEAMAGRAASCCSARKTTPRCCAWPARSGRRSSTSSAAPCSPSR